VICDEEKDIGNDPITFHTSWSADRINEYVESLFPNAIQWLKAYRPLKTNDLFYWVVLIPEKRRLAEFQKQGNDLNGKHIQSCKGGKGKRWDSTVVFFGNGQSPLSNIRNLICTISSSVSRISIPEKVWHGQTWDVPGSDSGAEETSDEDAESDSEKQVHIDVKGKGRAAIESDSESLVEAEKRLFSMREESEDEIEMIRPYNGSTINGWHID
jgi:hypothetical protein